MEHVLGARIGARLPVAGAWSRRFATLDAVTVVGAGCLLLALVYFARNASFLDFRAYYFGVEAISRGDRLYGPGLVWRDQAYTMFRPGTPPTQNGTYIYPPSAAVLFLPFTIFPFAIAARLWLIATYSCLLGTTFGLTRLLVPGNRRRQLASTVTAGALALLLHATRVQFLLGQADFVVLLLMVLTLVMFVRGHERRAGLLLALAVALKPTIGFLLLWFIWKRAYRGAVTFCITSAIVVGLSGAVFGLPVLLDFVAVAQYWSGPIFGVTPINQSPYGLLLRLFTRNPFTVPLVDAPIVVDIVRWVLIGLSLFMLARVVSRSRAISATQLALEYGLLTTTMLIAGPLSEDIHYVYLIIGFAAVTAALARRWERRAPALCLAVMLLATYAYLSFPDMVSLFFAFDVRVSSPITAPQLLLTGAMVYGLALTTALIIMTLRWYRRHAHLDGPAVLRPAVEAATCIPA